MPFGANPVPLLASGSRGSAGKGLSRASKGPCQDFQKEAFAPFFASLVWEYSERGYKAR